MVWEKLPRQKILLVVGIYSILGGLGILGGVFFFRQQKTAPVASNDVTIPTIINGELVLPKTVSNLSKMETATRLGVVSANLVGVFDQQKFVGIRIVGEMTNLGGKVVDRFSPLVRFFDKDNKLVGQKVGRNSASYDFFGVGPGNKSLYDITVDNPPTSDKVEIVLNVESATTSAVFDELKIASRSVEIKIASDSAGQKVEYYLVSGKVVNQLDQPVSDIAVFSWGRNHENKVMAVGRADFKNDLLMAGDKVDFKIILLPLKDGEKLDSYEVAAWGKKYRLNL